MDISKNKTLTGTDKYPPSFSWQEIKKHNNQNDCWIVIDEFVYDITPWNNKHPGGNVLTTLAGEDATAMFYSSHFEIPKKLLEQFLIGTVDNYEVMFDSYDDEFFTTLKSRVKKFYKDNDIDYRKTTKSFYLIIFSSILLITSWLCMYFLPPWGVLAAIPMGFATSSLIGTYGHDLIHGNIFTRLSKRRGFWILNDTLWGLFVPFMPESYFQYEHIRHHNFPMHPKHDYDVYALKDVVRLSDEIPKKPQHNFQHMYAPFAYGYYIFLQLLGGYTTTFFDDRELLKDRGNLRDIIFSSIIAFSFHIALPIYLTNIWWVILCAGIYFFTWQSAIYISAGIPHMTGSTEKENKLNSWSFHVCNTTKNLKVESRFISWATGGLNCHINHHLLPSVPQEHLPVITPIIEQTCKEFGYPYHNYNSFFTYYNDHFKFLKSLGKNDTELNNSLETA